MSDLQEQLQASLHGSYQIERELGGGGMSRVFVARDQRLGRQIVIKVLANSVAVSAERFEREITVAASLQDPHIVPVLTAGDVDGTPYYTMPFVAGESLRKRMDAGAIPRAEALAILRDVARALAYAHAHGVIHRDIKPDNVLLAGDTAVVTDFGIAKALSAARRAGDSARARERPPGRFGDSASEETLTQLGTSLGTPAYMSPEQAAGDVADARADIYAWGVMAYELLSGAHPFANKTTAQQLIAAHIAETPAPLGKDVPRAIATLVGRCLAKAPDERPQSASELVSALDTQRATKKTPATRVIFGIAVLGAAAIAVLAVVLLTQRHAARPADTTISSVAVLPFANVGGDSSQAYFSDGMTDELSGVLTKIPNLRVASRRAVNAVANRNEPPQVIARTLGVRALLDGTVRRAGDRVRVKVDLTGADSGTVLWTHTYEQSLQNVFAVQDSIAAAVAQELRLVFTGQAVAASRAGRTTSPEAHDLYLRGVHEFAKATEPGNRAAIALYKRALEIDPNYALAWVGIARSWMNLADAYIPSREGYPKAVDAVRKALAIDSMVPEAHSVFGYASVGMWDIPTGMRELRRGAELNPNSVDALSLLGNVECYFARDLSSGTSHVKRAVSLDSTSIIARWMLSMCEFEAKRYDDAIAQRNAAMAIDSTFFYVDDFAAESYVERGELAKAAAIYERARRLWPRPPYGLIYAYAKMGRIAEARKLAVGLEHASASMYVDPDEIALGYSGLGDADNAMKWFDRAVRDKATLAIGIGIVPAVEPIKNDPRYRAFVARMDEIAGRTERRR